MAGSRNRPSAEPVGQAISECLARYVRADDTMLVGYSGGLDSAVLLHALSRLPLVRAKLAALHVHHGLSENADAWAEFCGHTCRELGVPLQVARVEVPAGTGRGVEAEARRTRFGALAGSSSDWILLGHHANDQAETLLHNLLRGSGVRGAAAIPLRHGRVLRPFLGLTRRQLGEYAHAHGIRWVEDESNGDLRYTRNYLRHRILTPAVKKFPRAVEQLAAAAARFAEASELLDELALEDLRGNPPGFPLPILLLEPLSDRRVANLLRAMLCRQGEQAPSQTRLNEFVRQVRQAAADRQPRLDLPAYSLVRRQARICLERR